MKLIQPKMHRNIDYMVILAYAIAPRLFGFSRRASIAMYILTVYHAALTLMTERPIGQAGLVSRRRHAQMESMTPATLAALPWVARFSNDSAGRNFFLGSALAVLATRLTTNYR